jgi:CHAD domain-containing protein
VKNQPVLPQTALLHVFDERVSTYLKQLAYCQQLFSEEAVHDLRVSIRRLLAMLDLLKQVAPGLRRQKKLRRRLKRQLAGLGALRDTQVMLATVRAMKGKPPAGHQAFVADLLRQEAHHLLDVKDQLLQCPSRKIKRRLHQTRKQWKAVASDIDMQQTIRWAVDTAYANVCVRDRRARRDNAASIHRVRIAFKHFRYMVEIMQQVRPVYPARTIHAMRQYQTLLGDIQDAGVLQASVAEFAGGAAPVDAVPLQLYARQRYTVLTACYWRQREKLAGFQLPASQVVSV